MLFVLPLYCLCLNIALLLFLTEVKCIEIKHRQSRRPLPSCSPHINIDAIVVWQPRSISVITECDPSAAFISVDSTTDALFQKEKTLKESEPLPFYFSLKGI